ncbi:hypothetical protein BU24DRAFT_462063 [Aaosphaeria arxii CBS 175.79]|uniref:Histone-lysine N-methyltransferase, H3 lysine-4 specific n=1 Tax=Aaosphaeria arxii CBS 175.79 TaxID=1450172 RepID=A0A6A5XSC8_9PLEO|nr:uncharacterized protein BU24DRAFT_462063 [Aaosphaeria arxii CBS 175.79]KAF2015843.1 hypothetical protein BU24DRAFT_462063 [Aaosphaeria arxii CBS 175.79]
MSYSGHSISLHALTPLTSTDSSPPGKFPSPRSAKISNETLHTTGASSHIAPMGHMNNSTGTMTPVHTPPETKISTRPEDGNMGMRISYDPLLDQKLDSKRRASSKVKATYKEIIEKGDPSPPPDPRLAIAGYTSGKYVVKTQGTGPLKCKLRIAPYVAKPYPFDKRLSCAPDAPTQVVVMGFDPLVPESQVRAFFTGFGNVESAKNQVHPDNGSPLGICLIRYRDSLGSGSRRIGAVPASESAKRAVKEGSGQRIGLKQITVRFDREGRRCNSLVTKAVEQSRKEESRLRDKMAQKAAPSPIVTTDLPANVPKGPSGKGIAMRPPAAGSNTPTQFPQPFVSRKAQCSHLIEQQHIKPRLKRKPYIFIAHAYVPVLGTTIEHLKKRLKSYEWTDVRCDETGYFITFHESRRGEEETVRCFKECNMAALFTYVMNMECNPYGDPDYERSPSPERVAAQQKRQAEEDRIIQEEADDFEFEKKQRADNLCPVQGAMEMVKADVLERILGDIKSRIAGTALVDAMAPEKHAAKRRRLNIPDPQSKDEVRPPTLFPGLAESPAYGTPHSRGAGFSGRHGRKALGPFDHNRMRGKKFAKPTNVYGDERRKKIAPKRTNVRGLHHQLFMKDDEEDSDDEGRSSFTRDTEEQESRPISRAPSTDLDDEESARANRLKRRRIEAGWGEDSDDEMMDDTHARSLLAHLIHKDPEHMAEKELEQVLAILPRSSPIWKKADKALKGFRRLRLIEQEADEIFGVEPGVETSVEAKQQPEVVIKLLDEDSAVPIQSLETEELAKPTKKKAAPTKPKKKTKKQLQEEAKAAAVQVTEITRPEEELPEVEEPKAEPEVAVSESEATPEDERASVQYGVSTGRPRPTVEDDLSVVMDIDGWQHLVKDDEDLIHLKNALQSVTPAKVGDVQSWAWKQKQIKHLNRPGEEGVSRTETKIEGYYVPNSTGSARTEGVKKIRESEKSKYLPHRIRVQKEREERERRAKNEQHPNTVVEGFKFSAGVKTTQTSNSRANRANNRRLVNDINISKSMTGAEGDAMRFNQLKKRKKFVKFDRSAIHNWGLYAQENITANDMIIEYVGEKVRQRVADLREAKYDMQGVGSSYLFRIDEDTVIDATKMGGIARFINHSCTPNCTAKIIRVDGTKRIVIYALRDIGQDEELTYDYKFEREMDATDRIPCLCGSVGCKGFLN